MNILGLNAFHGDASAALLKDGILVSAFVRELVAGASEMAFDGGREVALKGLRGTQRVYAVEWRAGSRPTDGRDLCLTCRGAAASQPAASLIAPLKLSLLADQVESVYAPPEAPQHEQGANEGGVNHPGQQTCANCHNPNSWLGASAMATTGSKRESVCR